jgi:hypothetical protein
MHEDCCISLHVNGLLLMELLPPLIVTPRVMAQRPDKLSALPVIAPPF